MTYACFLFYCIVVYPPQNKKQSDLNKKILSLLASSDDILWIGTSGGGLTKFDLNTETFQNFSLAQGLSSSVVYGILEDENSNLWLSTDDG
ncbi:MAG: two-component regulator propeller domain-containing protein, partial [Dolichospermum sp.]